MAKPIADKKPPSFMLKKTHFGTLAKGLWKNFKRPNLALIDTIFPHHFSVKTKPVAATRPQKKPLVLSWSKNFLFCTFQKQSRNAKEPSLVLCSHHPSIILDSWQASSFICKLLFHYCFERTSSMAEIVWAHSKHPQAKALQPINTWKALLHLSHH